MATLYGFYLNASICTGCKACMMSCNDRNNLASGQSIRKIYEFGAGSWSAAENEGALANEVVSYYASLACQQCDMPMCVAACSTGALAKDPDTGIVMLDPEVCQACLSCQKACPYHHPTFDAEANVAKKCMLCIDEPKEDGSPNPACAMACPMRALEFGEMEDLKSAHADGVNVIGIFNDKTAPNVVITPRSEAERAVTVELLNPNELPGLPLDMWG